ncbi:MAG: thioesterase family protein [Candidatus Omnitrophota bacterium]
MRFKIYYHHTDCGGVVYYANYLKFLEEARTEFLAEKGISVQELARQDALFVVARQEIDYKLPAFYADTLEVDTHVSAVGGARVEFDYEIRNQNNQIVSKAKTTLVFVDKSLRPKVIPEEIRKLILS